MRESLFIKQNSAKWKDFETIPTRNPDEIAQRFISITDDLSYAKTFYPKSKTTAYLNQMAAGFHKSIYKNKKEKTSRFLLFWKLELPSLFFQYRWQLLFSLAFFLTCIFAGVLSAKYEESFVRLILGDEYVNMTQANIAKGDPFGVYKKEGSYLMFLYIAKNNLYVTVLTYLSGILMSFGTLFVLLKNGIMLGVFEYLFFSQDLGLKSILVIWIHGTLEISCIIIAGAAGLVLGNSILFPKTYTRLQSFSKGAKDGMKIIIGILPIVVLAAIFESFITRHTEMPIWLSLSILGGSFLFIVFYVIIYPYYLFKKINS